jgi:hypothetical protein
MANPLISFTSFHIFCSCQRSNIEQEVSVFFKTERRRIGQFEKRKKKNQIAEPARSAGFYRFWSGLHVFSRFTRRPVLRTTRTGSGPVPGLTSSTGWSGPVLTTLGVIVNLLERVIYGQFLFGITPLDLFSFFFFSNK